MWACCHSHDKHWIPTAVKWLTCPRYISAYSISRVSSLVGAAGWACAAIAQIACCPFSSSVWFELPSSSVLLWWEEQNVRILWQMRITSHLSNPVTLTHAPMFSGSSLICWSCCRAVNRDNEPVQFRHCSRWSFSLSFCLVKISYREAFLGGHVVRVRCFCLQWEAIKTSTLTVTTYAESLDNLISGCQVNYYFMQQYSYQRSITQIKYFAKRLIDFCMFVRAHFLS